MTTNLKADFVWPAYKNDKERIKFLSRKYKDVPIVEAFASEYNFPINQLDEHVDITPVEPRIGDVLDVHIASIDKNRVVFDTMNLKNELISKVNLYKYSIFRNFIPTDFVKVMVTDIDKQRVYVDPIAPLMDAWMSRHIGDKLYQKQIKSPHPVKVKNLRLVAGGFLGEAVVSDVTDFVREEYTVSAFIPGSQIVLNIAEDFNDYVGKEVDAFVVNYLKKPNGEISVICSVKEYLKFQGECIMMDMFNSWCDGTDYWKMVEQTSYPGKVTGIINSSKKCGVFVEIPSLKITGLVSTKPEELVNYKPHSDVMVKIKGFDEETYFNQTMRQIQHVEPYIIKNGSLEKCNLKPILALA